MEDMDEWEVDQLGDYLSFYVKFLGGSHLQLQKKNLPPNPQTLPQMNLNRSLRNVSCLRDSILRTSLATVT